MPTQPPCLLTPRPYARLLLAVALTASLGCKSPCALSPTLATRAGSGATDCGRVAVGADPSAVDACVTAAFTRGTPFVAEYGRQGIDSALVFGIVRDASGTVSFLLWDGDPSGGSGHDPVITETICMGPSVNTDAMRDRANTPPLRCASSTDRGRTCE